MCVSAKIVQLKHTVFGQTDRQTDRQAGRQAETDRLETERETVREGETQRQTKTQSISVREGLNWIEALLIKFEC